MKYKEQQIYPTKAEIAEGIQAFKKSIQLQRGLTAVQVLAKKRDKKR
jgi:hypothetical protein